MMSARPIVHLEIPAQDPAKTAAFYKEMFDWDITQDETMDYFMFKSGPMTFGEPGLGGGFPRVDGQMYKPGDVTVYVGSGDIDADLKKIESLGGKCVASKMEIPQTGWFAIFADPAGNRMALFTPMPGSGM
jgi:uncharacterized protein